jgi:hypothetical protein
MMAGPSGWSSRITGRIRDIVPGLERVLTRSGEPVRKKMTEAPEPMDKLDAATALVGVVVDQRTLLCAGARLTGGVRRRTYGGCGSGSSRRARRGIFKGSAGCRS